MLDVMRELHCRHATRAELTVDAVTVGQRVAQALHRLTHEWFVPRVEGLQVRGEAVPSTRGLRP